MRGAALAVLVTACATVPVPKALALKPGPYRIFGRAGALGCGNEIVLAAKTLTLSPDLKVAHADVVERDYAISVAGTSLFAEGTFPQPGCDGRDIHETWELHPVEGGLEGLLSSWWVLPSDCATACATTFELMLTP